MKYRTYADEFPPGSRIIVHASMPREGTDHEWHGHTGTVVGWSMWCEIKMDKRKRYWPPGNVFICGHNIRHLPQTASEIADVLVATGMG